MFARDCLAYCTFGGETPPLPCRTHFLNTPSFATLNRKRIRIFCRTSPIRNLWSAVRNRMSQRATPKRLGWDRLRFPQAVLVPTDMTTSGRASRGASHRASPYALYVARELVAMGRATIGRPAVMWIDPWQIAVRWQDERKYAILAYQTQDPATQQVVDQLADAFTRISGKKVVEYRQASPFTGFLFFGGAPPEIKIASVEFQRIEEKVRSSLIPQIHPWFKIR